MVSMIHMRIVLVLIETLWSQLVSTNNCLYIFIMVFVVETIRNDVMAQFT